MKGVSPKSMKLYKRGGGSKRPNFDLTYYMDPPKNLFFYSSVFFATTKLGSTTREGKNVLHFSESSAYRCNESTCELALGAEMPSA